jgi:hypothetical protein
MRDLQNTTNVWRVKKAFQDGAQIYVRVFRGLGSISDKLRNAKWLVCVPYAQGPA